MTFATSPATTHSRSALIEHAAAARGVRETFAVASRRLRRLLSFDAALWLETDPATMLPSAAARLENFDGDGCTRCWELELLSEDVNSFHDLGWADFPAGALAVATGGCPARSPRYRDVLGPRGFADELRVVLRTGGSVWGAVALLRERGRPVFGSEEIGFAAGLSQPLAKAIRDASPAPTAGGDARGFMLFAPDGELISTDDHALALLDELAHEPDRHAEAGTRLPIPVATTLAAARAIAERRRRGPARTRLRSRTGRLLAAYASCLSHPDGRAPATALVIEPATASDVAAIAMRAHELTARERQVAGLISQGCDTTAMARRLHLSIHTVRDHVKSILGKFHVSTRGELVAKLTGTLAGECNAPARRLLPSEADRQ